jgi:Protein of unknown function (DUF3320)
VNEAVPDEAPAIVPRLTQQSTNEIIKAYEFCQLDIALEGNDLHLVPTGQLVEWLAQVVAVESPVHWMEAGRRIADALGIQRLGSRIQDALTRASRAGSRAKKFVLKGDFLFRVEPPTLSLVRDRSEFPQQTKKLEYVAPEEICAAIEHAVLTGFGMPPEDIPVAACRLLGFARVSEEMRSVVADCRDSLVAQGCLEQRAEMLVHRSMS